MKGEHSTNRKEQENKDGGMVTKGGKYEEIVAWRINKYQRIIKNKKSG